MSALVRRCSKCRCDKSLTAFYGKGSSAYCRSCSISYTREWQRHNPDRKRLTDRNFNRKRRQRPGYSMAESRRYRAKYPYKGMAQTIARFAIYVGFLKRAACEVCGTPNTHAHHDDYSQPLNVRFLCPIHHKAAHAVDKYGGDIGVTRIIKP